MNNKIKKASKDIWLIGPGYMGIEYAKVLNSLNAEYQVLGRSQKSKIKFFKETGVKVENNDIEYIQSKYEFYKEKAPRYLQFTSVPKLNACQHSA